MPLSFGFGGPPVQGLYTFANFEWKAGRQTVIDAETGIPSVETATSHFPITMTTNPQYAEEFHTDPPINPDLTSQCGSIYDVGIVQGVSDRYDVIGSETYFHNGVFVGTGINLIGIPLRSKVLDQCPKALRDHFVSALMNVALGPVPFQDHRLDTWYIDGDPTQAANEAIAPQECEPGVYGHHTQVITTGMTSGITVGLAGVTFDGSGNIVLRGLGIGVTYDASDTALHAVDVTNLVEAYFALDTQYPAVALFVTAPLASGSPVFGGTLDAFLDALYAATAQVSISAHTWIDAHDHFSFPIGTVTTTYVSWGVMTTALGKASFDGITLGTQLHYAEIPPVIR